MVFPTFRVFILSDPVSNVVDLVACSSIDQAAALVASWAACVYWGLCTACAERATSAEPRTRPFTVIAAWSTCCHPQGSSALNRYVSVAALSLRKHLHVFVPSSD